MALMPPFKKMEKYISDLAVHLKALKQKEQTTLKRHKQQEIIK